MPLNPLFTMLASLRHVASSDVRPWELLWRAISSMSFVVWELQLERLDMVDERERE